MEKLKEALKPHLQVLGLATLFLMGTTFISLILIVVPTWLNPNIYLENLSWGSAILGSIFGQFTLLVALAWTKKRSIKDIVKWVEDLDDEI